MRSHSSCLFDIGQSLLVDFDLCASTRLVFLTLVSRCWWTLTCVLPLVLSFFDTGQPLSVDFGLCAPTRLVFFTLISRWSVAVGGLWLVRFHSSCLFHTGQPLLVDYGLCAPTRLVFFTLVSRCVLPMFKAWSSVKFSSFASSSFCNSGSLEPTVSCSMSLSSSSAWLNLHLSDCNLHRVI